MLYTHYECAITFDIHNLDRVGKKHEHKIEKINYKHNETPEETLKIYEENGWKGRVEDLSNPHNTIVYTEIYKVVKVSFDRWVDN